MRTFQGLWCGGALCIVLLVLHFKLPLGPYGLCLGGGFILSLLIMGFLGSKLGLRNHQALMAFTALTPWPYLGSGKSLWTALAALAFIAGEALILVFQARRTMTTGVSKFKSVEGYRKAVARGEAKFFSLSFGLPCFLAVLLSLALTSHSL